MFPLSFEAILDLISIGNMTHVCVCVLELNVVSSLVGECIGALVQMGFVCIKHIIKSGHHLEKGGFDFYF